MLLVLILLYSESCVSSVVDTFFAIFVAIFVATFVAIFVAIFVAVLADLNIHVSWRFPLRYCDYREIL